MLLLSQGLQPHRAKGAMHRQLGDLTISRRNMLPVLPCPIESLDLQSCAPAPLFKTAGPIISILHCTLPPAPPKGHPMAKQQSTSALRPLTVVLKTVLLSISCQQPAAITKHRWTRSWGTVGGLQNSSLHTA